MIDDAAGQTRQVFEHIKESLALAGATMDDVVKAVLYITDFGDFDAISRVRNEYFKNSNPVSTCVGATGFSRKGAKVEIEVTAILAK